MSRATRAGIFFPQRWKFNGNRTVGEVSYLTLCDGQGVAIDEAIIDTDCLALALRSAHWRKIEPRAHLTYASGHERGHKDSTAKRQRLYLHRLVMGVTDPTIMVDHGDGNGLDCRRKNLRVTDNRGNQLNQYHHRRVRMLETENAALLAEIDRLNALVETLRRV